MNLTIETIYQDFHSKLYQCIVGRVSDPDTAEDILQDVYLKIHSNRLQSWICQITRNAITDYYRRVRPQDELPGSLASPPEEEPDATKAVWTGMTGVLVETSLGVGEASGDRGFFWRNHGSAAGYIGCLWRLWAPTGSRTPEEGWRTEQDSLGKIIFCP